MISCSRCGGLHHEWDCPIIITNQYQQIVVPDNRQDDLPKKAVKFDKEKLRTDLIPVAALESITAVLTYGAKKYGAHNWIKGDGLKWSQCYGAALRHLFAYWKGEDIDPESHLPHLAHAGCCILFLLHYYLTGHGTNDRKVFTNPLGAPLISQAPGTSNLTPQTGLANFGYPDEAKG